MIRPGHATAATSARPHSSPITCLEQGVDERRDGAGLREDDQQPEQHEHEDNRNEPVFFSWRRNCQNSENTLALPMTTSHFQYIFS